MELVYLCLRNSFFWYILIFGLTMRCWEVGYFPFTGVGRWLIWFRVIYKGYYIQHCCIFCCQWKHNNIERCYKLLFRGFIIHYFAALNMKQSMKELHKGCTKRNQLLLVLKTIYTSWSHFGQILVRDTFNIRRAPGGVASGMNLKAYWNSLMWVCKPNSWVYVKYFVCRVWLVWNQCYTWLGLASLDHHDSASHLLHFKLLQSLVKSENIWTNTFLKTE